MTPALEIPAAAPAGQKEFPFAAIVTGLFLACAAAALSRHELWRDELQAWLIARDSASWAAFFSNLRYEGAPPAWHLLLRLLCPSAPAMQALHGLLGTCWVFLLCRYAPFPRYLRLLLSFSYYVFYQYTVVSRNYSLGLLLLTGVCVLFNDRERHPWVIGALLAAAALTSAPALLVAAALMCACRCGDPLARAKTSPISLLYVLGALAAIGLMAPPQDALFPSSPGWITHFHLQRCFQVGEAVVKAFFPTPVPGPRFWENPWIAQTPHFAAWGWVLALVILGWGYAACGRSTAARVAYGVGTLLMLAFFYGKYLGFSRHQGFLFFNFIFALWIARVSPPEKRATSARRRFDLSVYPVLGCLLLGQGAGAATAAFYDWTAPFSYGKEVAGYLTQNGLSNATLAAGPDYLGVPVIGYLHRPFYSAQGDRWQTFTRWDLRRIEMFDDRVFIRRAKAATRSKNQPLIMMINYPLDPAIAKENKTQFLHSFTGSLVGDEDYYLYQL